MSRRRRMLRPLVAGFVVVAFVVMTSLAAGAVVITSFTGLLGAAAGTGWAPHPDQTAGGTEQFVTGPATPPAGTGSLEMTVAANTDRALIFTVPKGGSAGPNDIGVASPWTTLTGSFSTFTSNTAAPASSIPVLKIVGFQHYNTNNPLLSTGFTTLNFEGSNQGTVTANQWQTWTLGPDSVVWQSNQTDDPGFCPQADPCTLSEFAAHYDTPVNPGAWGQLQLGLGAGVPAGSSGNVDDVTISDGTTTFVYDFEVTAPAASSTTSTTTSAAAGGSATTAVTSGTPLARTGSHTAPTLALALAFITAGTALALLASRRERRAH